MYVCVVCFCMCIVYVCMGYTPCMLVWRPEVDWLSSSITVHLTSRQGILMTLTILTRHRPASPQNPHASTSQHRDYIYSHPHLALYGCWRFELWSSCLYSKCFYHWATCLALLSILCCISIEEFLIQIIKLARTHTFILQLNFINESSLSPFFLFSLCSPGACTQDLHLLSEHFPTELSPSPVPFGLQSPPKAHAPSPFKQDLAFPCSPRD